MFKWRGAWCPRHLGLSAILSAFYPNFMLPRYTVGNTPAMKISGHGLYFHDKLSVYHTTRHLKCRSNWQRRMVLFLMVLTASKYIIIKSLQLMSFKSMIKSTIRRISVV